MSKIIFKVNKKPEEETKKVEAEQAPKEEVAVSSAQDATAEPVQIALFPQDEEKPNAEPAAANTEQPFDKEKIIKYFKSHPKKAVSSKVERFSPKLNKGLSAEIGRAHV